MSMTPFTRPGRAAHGTSPRPSGQGGFTLLEVLVAIIVISLGLLGLAGLQAASLTNNQTAYYRAIATQQAYDMADRMRANMAGVRAGNYDALGLNTPADPGCIVAGCTVPNMAVTDHFQWNTNNARLLPNGDGSVQCTTGPTAGCTANGANRAYAITVRWIEKNMNDAGANSSDPNCPAGSAPNTRCFVTALSP